MSEFAIVLALSALAGTETRAWRANGIAPVRPYVTLPPVIYAVPGDRCAIHFRNVTDAVRPEIYGYRVTCPVGRNDGTCWSWTPAKSDAGRRVPLVLTLVSDTCAPSVATTCVAVAKLPKDRSRPLSLALLADSLTNCRYQDRLLDRMRAAGFANYRPVGSRTGFSAAPIGTFEPGKAAHDGYGGYSWESFLTRYVFATDEIDNLQSEAERRQLEKDGVKIGPGSEWRRHLLKSPLVRRRDGKNVVDIPAWFDRINGGRTPDVILIELGGNDFFWYCTDEAKEPNRKLEDRCYRYVNLCLDALRAAAPEALIALATPPVGGFDSGFAANYGCAQTSFAFRSNMFAYMRMIDRCLAARKDPRLTTVPIHHGIDRETGYPKDNAIHLTLSGGETIGDELFAWLVGQMDIRKEGK